MEVVDVLLELLLKSSKSLDFVEYLENPQSSKDPSYVLTAFDEWKPVIKKLSNKEPGLLWDLLDLVLEKILISETGEKETGKTFLNFTLLVTLCIRSSDPSTYVYIYIYMANVVFLTFLPIKVYKYVILNIFGRDAHIYFDDGFCFSLSRCTDVSPV